MFSSKRLSRLTHTSTQMHMLKKNKAMYCFHYPLPPLLSTQILEPSDQSSTCEEITKDLTNICPKKVTTLLQLEMNNPMSFNQF